MKMQILFCLLVLMSAHQVWAWGAIGHKSTALIAEAYLSPRAKANVNYLLQGQRMVDVANWADSLRDRPEYAHTIPYHYQNTRTQQTGAPNMNSYRQNLLQLSPGERRNYRAGVVEAIAGSEMVLRDPKATTREKQLALKFLVHFVGDLHQPLHTGEARKVGGNTIRLVWNGNQTNLHKVWDSEIIYEKVGDLKGSRFRDPSWSYAQWLLDTHYKEATQGQILGNIGQWYQESLLIKKQLTILPMSKISSNMNPLPVRRLICEF